MVIFTTSPLSPVKESSIPTEKWANGLQKRHGGFEEEGNVGARGLLFPCWKPKMLRFRPAPTPPRGDMPTDTELIVCLGILV